MGARPIAFVDADVLLRHFLQDDPDRSPRATAYLRRVELGEIEVHTAETVIFEVVFNLQRRARFPRNLIRDGVVAFIDLPNVVLSSKQRLRDAFDLYVRLNIPFADAYHSVIARSLDPPTIIAFDRHYGRVPGVTCIEP